MPAQAARSSTAPSSTMLHIANRLLHRLRRPALCVLNGLVILSMCLVYLPPARSAAATPAPDVEAAPTPTATPPAADEQAVSTGWQVTPTLTATVELTTTATLTAAVPETTPVMTATVTPENSPTPQATSTSTLEHTPTATVSVSASPTPTTSPTATPGAPVTIAPTSTAAPAPTLPPTAEPTVIPPVDSAAPLTLTLRTCSDYTPGEMVIVGWQITGTQAAQWKGKTETLSLTVSLPDGFTPLVVDQATYDAQKQQQRSGVQALAGEYYWLASAESRGQTSARVLLEQNGRQIVQGTVVLKEKGLTTLTTKGGAAKGMEGKVQVIFPEGAAGEGLEVRVRKPAPASLPPSTLSDHPFEITAVGVDSRQAVRKFQKPLTIQVSYDEAGLIGSEETLLLYYYDTEQGAWQPVETKVDAEANLLIAETDHLTVYDAASYEAGPLPSMENFLTSSFTGAAAYEYALWTPPGPGGLRPELKLTYNSQIMDEQYSGWSQSGWVGMGWSLDTGYIQVNEGNSDVNTDDTFTLVLHGKSERLVKGNDNYYHAEGGETFDRIQFVHNTSPDYYYWVVWDKVGNTYRFGTTDESRLDVGADSTCRSIPYWPTLRWHLTQEENPFGKKILYNYTEMTRVVAQCESPMLDAVIENENYLSSISYSDSAYTIEFENEDRADHPALSRTVKGLHMTKRLKAVHIKNAGAEIRRYDFTYTDIWPGILWNPDNSASKNFAIGAIQETGINGTTQTALPGVELTYSDGMHLTQAENGYGGRVNFTYENSTNNPQPWIAPQGDVGTNNTGPYAHLSIACSAAWSAYQSGSFYTCGDQNQIVIGRSSGNAAVYHRQVLIRPGGAYKVSARFSFGGGRIGMRYYTGSSETVLWNSASYSGGTVSAIFVAGAKTNVIDWIVECSAFNCQVASPGVEFELLPAYYRVTTRNAYDGRNSEPALSESYVYDGPAMNDANVSYDIWLRGENNYVDPYAEFRGHAMVETSKTYNGNTVSAKTWFMQDDEHRGSPSVSLNAQRLFEDQFEGTSLDASQWASYGSVTLQSLHGDQAVKIVREGTWWKNLLRGTMDSGVFQPAVISNDAAIVTQFMVVGSNAEAFLGAENPETTLARRWGIYAKPGSAMQVWYGADNSPTDLGTWAVETGVWYVAMLIVDNDHLYARVWKRSDPTVSGVVEKSGTGIADTESWVFRAYLQDTEEAGELWVDDYFEGKVFNLNENIYHPVQHPFTTSIPSQYGDLDIDWSPLALERQYVFEQKGLWYGKATYHYYETSQQGGAQYGNETQTVETVWENSGWADKRVTSRRYYPNISSYLVGLPAFTNRYACNASDANGSCYTSIDQLAHLLSSEIYYYTSENSGSSIVNTSSYAGQPGGAKLGRKRTLIDFTLDANGNPIYSSPNYTDELYGYDAYGNQILSTTYSNKGAGSAFATATARSSQACYGSYTTAGSDCSADSYHTYATWEKNAAGHVTQKTWNTNVGKVATVQGPNDSAVTRTVYAYDLVGRITQVTSYPDVTSDPTLVVEHHDNATGYWVQLTQRIDAEKDYILRKNYDGLGRLVQTQILNATVENVGGKTIVTDYAYNSLGKEWKVSIPYDAANGSNQPKTETNYDLLGRKKSVKSTDGSTYNERYTYSVKAVAWEGNNVMPIVRGTDAKGNYKVSYSDALGRTLYEYPYDVNNNALNPRVSYDYDLNDQVTAARSGANNIQVSFAYDFLGRKVAQNDPDLGNWTFTYNALNLTSQTDARSCTTAFTYDLLNRLTGKSYSGSGCSSASPVTYTYDATSDGNKGIGMRTSISANSNTRSWKYDERGRTIMETLAIDGLTFKTQFTYNSADKIVTLNYPGGGAGESGETVTYTYLPQLLPYSLNMGGNYYVSSAKYDAAGRITGMVHNNLVNHNWYYYSWSEVGKAGLLYNLRAGYGTDLGRFQNNYYNYDANGNVTSISDSKNGESRTFAYDGLDRLTNETIAGASQTTSYDSDGRILSRGGQTYTYHAVHKHAAVSYNGITYTYDSNGNAVTRNGGGKNYTFTYDAENRLTGVSGSNTNSYTYDADGMRVKSANVYQNLAPGAWVYSSCGVSCFATNTYAVSDGDMDVTSGSSREYTQSRQNGVNEYAQYDLGTNYSINKLKIWHYNSDGRKFHGTKLEYQPSGGSTWTTVFSSTAATEYNESLVGREYTFSDTPIRKVRDWLNGNTVDNTNRWVEMEVWGWSNIYYVNKYYEYRGSHVQSTRYYEFNGMRIAMRRGPRNDRDGMVYLATDHLGGVNLTLDHTDGHILTELRYNAWGATRLASGSTPTSVRFTGQHEDEEIPGLYDFNARWYDSSLGRFLQADTVVPGGDGVSWDRYAYSRNNPVKYVDPDGHFAFVPFLIAAGLLTLKAVDYGWTAYDIYQSGKVLNDPSASPQEKEAAAATIATAIAFEAAEPDDALPGGLPLDDLARIGTLKVGDEILEEGADKTTTRAVGGVYQLVDNETGIIMRTGRTKNFAQRRAQHKRDPILKRYDFEEVWKTDDYFTQRGLEQIIHEKYHPPCNYINPIASGNPKYKIYIDSAWRFIDNME